jgi:hypothetical protein
VLRLATLSAAMDMNSWPDIVRVMERHLWMGSACNLGGERLWNEVMELRMYNLPLQCDAFESAGTETYLARYNSQHDHEDVLSIL